MNKEFPIQVNSWTILSNERFVKKMDKSTFVHHGTGIPMKISHFWDVDHLENGTKKQVRIKFNTNVYEMAISRDLHSRFRLLWNSSFSNIISEKFAELFLQYKNDEESDKNPEMIFTKIKHNSYEVEFIEEVFYEDYSDLEETFREGKVKYYYGTRYERDRNAREKAISFHGIDCKACGFNFKNNYGKLGDGFIEVHHIQPLFKNQYEVEIDPLKDLIPVCPNCHRMIHRKQHVILSVDEIRSLINENKDKQIYLYE